MVTEQMMAEKQAQRVATGAADHQRWLVWATAVMLLAALMRLVSLADIPPGLAQDEVLNADVVGFIRGGAHALFFREGYGHEPLYHYWSVPFQVLLGDNVLSIRLPAVTLGLLLVAATMRWARREFTPIVGLATGALLAVSWWPIIFSRIGLRPIMEPFLLVLFAWSWPRRPWIAGLFLGLSLYTYTGARVVFIWPLLLALYWLLFRKRIAAPQVTVFGLQLPQPFLAAAITLFVSLALFVPLWLTLRADPTLQERVQQLQGPLQSLQSGDAAPLLQSVVATLGVFSFTGDPRWTYMLPGKPLFSPLFALIFYAGLFLALWRFLRPPYAFVFFWLLVGILPSAVTPQAPSTVRMVGAMPAVYTLPALAAGWLWAQRKSAVKYPQLAQYGVPLLLIGLLILALGQTVQNGFIRWSQALETRLKYQSVLVDMADYLRQNVEEGPLVFAEGFFRPITADTLRRNLGRDPGGRWVQTGAELAGALLLPAQEGSRLIVPEYAAPDQLLVDAAGLDANPIFRSGGRPSFAVYDLPDEPDVDALDEALPFEASLSLVGYEIPTPRAGQALQLVTVWQVDEALPDDLAIFLHWLDDSGQLLAQHDGLDVAAETAQRGDTIIQRHVLPWPASLPNPSGKLAVGLYLRGDGRRLPVVLQSGELADSVTLSLPSIAEGERSPDWDHFVD